MSYDLGVDLGTTFTAAAIARGGRAETVSLAPTSAVIPSVAYLNEDGDLLFGQLAERRAATEPARVAREFKRRIGDPTPILLGGTPMAAEMLMARMLAWVVEQVAATEGEPPAHLAVTHPANWGDYKLDLLRQAVRHVDLTIDVLIAEPVAAAHFYVHSRPAVRERLAGGASLVVYDLGGGTFDAAVVGATDRDGLTIAGQPDGVERLGGIDVDHAVLGHVTSHLGIDPETFDRDDPAVAAALARLRQDCIGAKEALSDDTDASIPVLLPDLHTEVRLTRAELETMIRPTLDETVVALERTITSAEVTPEDIEAVLLVGGSSRIPLVGQLVASELNRPLAVDTRPKDAICHGAALSLSAPDEAAGAATPAVGSSGGGGAGSPAPAAAAVAGGAAAAGALAGAGAAAAASAASGGDLPPTDVTPVTEVQPAAAMQEPGVGVAGGGPGPGDGPPTMVAAGTRAAPVPRRGISSLNPLWAAAGVLAIGALVLGAVLLTGDDDTGDPTAIADSGDAPTTDDVAAGGSTTAEEAATTTEQETTTTEQATTTTTESSGDYAPPPETAPPPDTTATSTGAALTVDASEARWSGSCYHQNHGAVRPVTEAPESGCRNDQGSDYYLRLAPDGAVEQGVCWTSGSQIQDQHGNSSSTWLQMEGGGYMHELYFRDWQTATDGLPPC